MTAAVAPEWDRFAHWRAAPARLVLALLLALMIAAALVPVVAASGPLDQAAGTATVTGGTAAPPAAERPRDTDLKLYDIAVERIRKGENYYAFIVGEQRRLNFPVRPGLAVRLPTLAYLNAWLGDGGQMAAALVLLAACMVVWWRRLGEEPGGMDKRLIAAAFLFVGTSLGLNRYYFALHELWAGMLLVLSFGLHRPGRRWAASLAVAALALAIREHSLPFVLLMAAMAGWRRDWKESAAWITLALAFLAALGLHLHVIAAQVTPGDPPSPSWLALRGLSGWLSDVALSSSLRFLPHWLAGPAVVLMTLGWCGWKSPAGTFGSLLFLGYGTGFMIAGRPDNFYWGAMIAPAMFIGFTFAPMAVQSLIASAKGKHG
ncbi:MAG: hypothetical protein KGL44_03290 [Sphingomonadales bacterium]|nr:hypothetical protein [Sphingomonadales bacterium]